MLSLAFLTAALGLASASPLAPYSLPSSNRGSPVLAPLVVPPAPPASSHPPPNPTLAQHQHQHVLSFTASPSSPPASDAHLIPNGYIVRLRHDLPPARIDEHHALVRSLHAEDVAFRISLLAQGAQTSFAQHEADLGGFEKALNVGKKFRAYSGKFSDELVERIRGLEGVEYVERDSIVWANEEQKFVPWGLHRVSHTKPIHFQTLIYQYEPQGGEGVDVYVIDTGIHTAHEEFEGRAEWGKTLPNDVDKDMNGHGTHVAGTIGSRAYGIAKQAHLIAVKVLGANGSGSMSDVIGGIDYAAEKASQSMAAAKAGKKKGHKGSVANMSLGGGKTQSLDDAVDAAVEEGLHFAVAAGNDDKDACTFSPAAAQDAITVGATTLADERAYFSNYGKCVDIMAPGLNIKSTWNVGNTTNVISGTSMASPHVAGMAAYFLSLYPKHFSPSAMDFEDSVYDALLAGHVPVASFLDKALGWVQAVADLTLGPGATDFGARTQAKAAPAVMTDEEALEKPLSPAVLKKVMTRLALKGALTDVKGSPNALLFNNFTSS